MRAAKQECSRIEVRTVCHVHQPHSPTRPPSGNPPQPLPLLRPHLNELLPRQPVWREVEAEFSALDNAAVVPLPENFRSQAPVIDFVDATIGKLLDTPIEGTTHDRYEVPFEPLEVGDVETQLEGPPVEVIVVPMRPEGKDYGADDVRVIGVDNSPYCNVVAVPLSSISRELRRRSAHAVRMLANLRDGAGVESVMFEPILHARESTR